MLCKLLTVIVFISEIIIVVAALTVLYRLDRAILELNYIVTAIRPGIKDIGYLVKKISAQYIDFAYDFVSKIKRKKDDSITKQLNKILITLILYKINSKLFKKIKKSKIFGFLGKTLSLLQLVV